jgi:hypothetical protein
MAQLIRIYISDDSSSTAFYETQYRIVGTTAYTQQIDNYPLPVYETVSPVFESSFIGISPLADATDYECQVRRFSTTNQYSDWVDYTFTTGS